MGLRTKIIVLVGAIALGVGLGSSILASRMVHQTLDDELRSQAKIAALSLSDDVTPLVQNGNIPQIDLAINKLLKLSPNFLYAYIVDFDGKLLTYSFANSLPETMSFEFLHSDPMPIEDSEISRFTSNLGPVLDIDLTLIEGQLAHIHIGINEEQIHSRLAILRKRIYSLTLLLTVMGITIGFYVSRKLTEPVQEELRKLGQAVEQSPTSIVITNAEGIIEYVNPKFEELTGYSLQEAMGNSPKLLKSGQLPDDHYKSLWETISRGEIWRGEFSNKKKNGELYWEYASISPIINEQNEITHYIAIKEDITERKQFEDALKESENRTRTTLNSISDAVFLHPLMKEGFACFVDVNDTACKTYGYTREQFLSLRATDITLKVDADLHSKHKYRKVLSDEKRMVIDAIHVKNSGEEFPVEIISSVIELSGVPTILSLVRDLTERKAADDRHEKLQVQFNQSQKMETVGRLAGGVAHDFNNMLGVIVGHCELALYEEGLSGKTLSHLIEIRKAADRSANLTRQLLAFARKQTINPVVLDLNTTIEDMLKLLRSLIGEDIDLAWLPGTKVWPVIMDPSQLDQILANLCVNARDSITDVGKVTIKTSSVTFDDNHCANHPEAKPGPFALITVSDNGCGMNDETKEKLFEPFFTTKPTGKGTGLGLSTIYGIVKQNNGFITVNSEIDSGSTFKIYLPSHLGQSVSEPTEEEKILLERGNETILIVEDEPAILSITAGILERQGYTIYSTSSPEEAIRIAEKSETDIQLLVTDMVMPEMSGKDLAEKLLKSHPALKCLFMSGYTSDMISNHGILHEGVNFLAKPFSLSDLTSLVRKTLDDFGNGQSIKNSKPLT